MLTSIAALVKKKNTRSSIISLIHVPVNTSTIGVVKCFQNLPTCSYEEEQSILLSMFAQTYCMICIKSSITVVNKVEAHNVMLAVVGRHTSL